MSEKLILTEQEKETLQNYDGENTFLKALSERLSDTGELTENQISAYRKTTDRLTRCPNTKLALNELCEFVDDELLRSVKVADIRERAIKIICCNTNEEAWIPSKAVSVELVINSNDNTEMNTLTLKSWFDKNETFWKPSKY